MTDLEIRALVRKQLVYYLKEEIAGDELLMKEVWEQCETSEHRDAAKRELAEVVAWLEARREPSERCVVCGKPGSFITALSRHCTGCFNQTFGR